MEMKEAWPFHRKKGNVNFFTFPKRTKLFVTIAVLCVQAYSEFTPEEILEGECCSEEQVEAREVVPIVGKVCVKGGPDVYG